MNISEEEKRKAEEITAILGEMAEAQGCVAAIVRNPSELRFTVMKENTKAFDLYSQAALLFDAAGKELAKGLPGVIFKSPLNFN